jgi:hypothetical protein
MNQQNLTNLNECDIFKDRYKTGKFIEVRIFRLISQQGDVKFQCILSIIDPNVAVQRGGGGAWCNVYTRKTLLLFASYSESEMWRTCTSPL